MGLTPTHSWIIILHTIVYISFQEVYLNFIKNSVVAGEYDLELVFSIYLDRMVMLTHIIIIKKLKPSPLAKIQIFLGEHILKILMVTEHIYMKTIQVVSLYIECKHHYFKIEVMSWIVLLKDLKLSKSISYNLISLHQHIT